MESPLNFNPRAPCGARQVVRQRARVRLRFQSTRPVWGATDGGSVEPVVRRFQSTRPVWGATRRRPSAGASPAISIHAPRVGRDDRSHRVQARFCNFNPRAPCGARRYIPSACSDLIYFNPRAPCGARRFSAGYTTKNRRFQSTRPVWGATANLTILPRQICTKGTKEFLLGRKTHGKKGKIK